MRTRFAVLGPATAAAVHAKAHAAASNTRIDFDAFKTMLLRKARAALTSVSRTRFALFAPFVPWRVLSRAADPIRFEAMRNSAVCRGATAPTAAFEISLKMRAG